MTTFRDNAECKRKVLVEIEYNWGVYFKINGETAIWTATKSRDEVNMKVRLCSLCDGSNCVFAVRGGEVLKI